jgi:hypothetical protein
VINARTVPEKQANTLVSFRCVTYGVEKALPNKTINKETRSRWKIAVVKPLEKLSLGRSSRIWTDNIKVDLRETGCAVGGGGGSGSGPCRMTGFGIKVVECSVYPTRKAVNRFT